MEPGLSLLGRYLRRRLAAARLTLTGEGESGSTTGVDHVIDWLQQVRRRVNRLLETHNSHDVTIGECSNSPLSTTTACRSVKVKKQ